MRTLLLLSSLLLLGAGGDGDAVRDELERIGIELMHADEQLRGATSRVREIEAGLAEREARLAELEAVLDERQAHMGRRVRAMYRMRHRGFLPLLFSARSAHELLRNARSLWWIVRADRAALDGFAADRADVDQLSQQLAQDRAQLLQRAGEVYARREEDRARMAALQDRMGLPRSGR